ncbi:MAG: hypothetical protein K9M02_10825 [Thiohalocapsa sp.]|nr:hypothetical protein [Thiohalocapsa sp.]
MSLIVLLLFCQGVAAGTGTCRAGAAVLVHPEVRGVYVDALERIAAGLEREGESDLGICSLVEFKGLDGLMRDAVVYALGDTVTAEVAAASRPAAVVGLLVTELPPSVRQGVSLFADPGAVIERLLALQPDIASLHLVHLAEVPADAIARARSAATSAGLQWQSTAISSVRDAARAIEQLKSRAGNDAAVWFHNGVLGLNPDVLIPALVRISWNRGLVVVADDAAYVERGILMSVSPDLEAVGALAARAARLNGPGLRDSAAVQWGVNRRTAVALGVEGQLRRRPAPDFVYE